MRSRRNVTFALGLVLFLVGGTIAYAALTRTWGDRRGGEATVLYAAAPIPAGTTGGTAVRQRWVESRSIATPARPASALTDVNQLAGRIAGATIPRGKILVAGDFPAAPTRLGTVRIPPDKTALALKLSSVAGVAGFAAAGDRVDLYAVAKAGGTAGSPSGPSVHLVLQGVEVLNVNGGTSAEVTGKPDAPDLVFLLAVTPAEAERLIYLTSFEQLYFSLIPAGQSPVAGTPGAGPADALRLA